MVLCSGEAIIVAVGQHVDRYGQLSSERMRVCFPDGAESVVIPDHGDDDLYSKLEALLEPVLGSESSSRPLKVGFAPGMLETWFHWHYLLSTAGIEHVDAQQWNLVDYLRVRSFHALGCQYVRVSLLPPPVTGIHQRAYHCYGTPFSLLYYCSRIGHVGDHPC